MSKPFLDYSQYTTYQRCPLAWAEKYIYSWRRAPKAGQKDDVLTVGSLVHTAMQTLRETGKLDIPQAVVEELSPTTEALAWSRVLALGASLRWPPDLGVRYYCEEPLRFELLEEVDGLAKIDCYFHLDEPTVRENGLGDKFTLSPGWWIDEYKTKTASKSIGDYWLSWKMNAQADFQMLALSKHVGEPVQGVLVNVIEKPKDYQPVRSCKACGAKSEFRYWTPTGEGYQCPQCFATQKLAPPDKKERPQGVYYRLPVTRTEKQLAHSKAEFTEVAEAMHKVRLRQDEPVRNREQCLGMYGFCEYFAPHSEGYLAEGYEGYVNVINPVRYAEAEPVTEKTNEN